MKAHTGKLNALDMALSYCLCAVICILSFAINTSSVTEYVFDPNGKWYAATYVELWNNNTEIAAGAVTNIYPGIVDYDKTQTSATLTYPDGSTDTDQSNCWAPPYGGTVDWTVPFSPGIWRVASDHYVGLGSCGNYVAHGSATLDLTQVSITYFYANPTNVPTGGSSTLSWSTTNGTSITINGTPVAASGSMVVTPSASTVYTLTVSNPFTNAQAKTLVMTNIPLTSDFYRYSVRHEKGLSPFYPFMPVERESVNSANGNLHFTVPLLSRPGRNGLGVNLNLAYNSKIWDFVVQGSTLYATLPEYDSWVGLGWTLTMGRMIDDSANGHYYFTSSDGSNHSLTYYGGAWRSMASTYMVYDPAAKKLTLKNGVNLRFDYQDPVRPYMSYVTRIQDTSGNFLDISYSGTGGRISTIQDTLGNTYTLLLNSNGRLQYLRYFNTNDTTQATSTISLGYQSISPSFGTGATTDPLMLAQLILTNVTYVTGVRHSFFYNSSGQLQEIGYPTFGISRYFYSKKTVYDRLLGRTVPDYYVTSHDTGNGTGVWTWSINPNGNSAPSTVEVKVPGRANIYHNMQMSSSGWADGFATSIVYRDSYLRELVKKEWTQDDEQPATIKNPRMTWTAVGKNLVQSPYTERLARSEFSYSPVTDYSGNVKEIREYLFDQVTLRRKTVLNYLHESNPSYANLNILDRVTSSLVYDGSDDLVSKTVTEYDSFSPLLGAPNAIRHNPTFGTTYLTRGLPTSVTRWHNIAQNGYIVTSTKYDECGNVREVIDPRSYSTFSEYWLSAADNAYAFPLQVSNAKGHVSSATYSYKSGVVLTQTDANGQIMTMTYDNKDRVTEATRADGWRKTIEYHESPSYGLPPYAIIRQYLTADTYQESRADLDYMGRLEQETAADPLGGDITQEREYGDAGQLTKHAVPHRAGATRYDVSYSTGGVQLKSMSLPGSNSITMKYWYNPNAVTIVEDPLGRKRKLYFQEDGKISQVLEQDVDTGELTVATDYNYDTLGRLTLISQGVQIRSFVYDDLGRLLSETHPENGTTTYSYDANSNLLSRTDARGIVTTYTYDELNRITQKTYSDGTPTG